MDEASNSCYSTKSKSTTNNHELPSLEAEQRRLNFESKDFKSLVDCNKVRS